MSYHTLREYPVLLWTDPQSVEPQALEQLQKLAALPFVFQHIAVMPDVHYGKGTTVGTVLATERTVIPAAVGVDIGCGMGAVKLPLTASQLPDSLAGIRSAIEAAVPVGHQSHAVAVPAAITWTGWNDDRAPRGATLRWTDRTMADILARAQRQMGTLGGGNHFIEVCLDEEQAVWIMLHSGSRNVGKELAEGHIKTAQRLMEQFFVQLPDKDLAFLPEGTREFDAYLHDVYWAQDYAEMNRRVMMAAVLRVFEQAGLLPAGWRPVFEVYCHHNYVAREFHFNRNVLVTRKGAVRARKDDYCIIPGSMGTRSYICKGRGAEVSYCSCSHGAGRRLSRNQAAKTFTEADIQSQLAGVECRKDTGIIDELPGAYKDIDTVMANQQELVEPIAVLKQVLCVKG